MNHYKFSAVTNDHSLSKWRFFGLRCFAFIVGSPNAVSSGTRHLH